MVTQTARSQKTQPTMNSATGTGKTFGQEANSANIVIIFVLSFAAAVACTAGYLAWHWIRSA